MASNKELNTKKFAKKKSEHFELLFVGDTSFGENYQAERKSRGLDSILESHGYDYSLAKMKPLMQRADFVVANLETPITNLKESPFADTKDYVHWTDVEKAPSTLLKHNVGLVSLANNHAYDFGKEGYLQTLDILQKHQLPYIGAGENIDEAVEPFMGEIDFEGKKFKFAIIGAFEDLPNYRKKYQPYATDTTSGLMPIDIEVISQQVKKIKKDDPSTFVIFYPHWGDNYRWKDQEQNHITHALLANGVDLIIGHGAHMIQEFEKINDKWALYSLGNFIFNSPGRYEKLGAPPFSYVAGMHIEVINDQFVINLKLYPFFCDNRRNDFQPRFLDEEEFYDLFSLIQRRNRSAQTNIYTLERKRDENGYYIDIPVTKREVGETKWVGLLCKTGQVSKRMQDDFTKWMFLAIVMENELGNHGFRLFCYSSLDINPKTKMALGYVLENGQFRQMIMPIPKISHDWYIGSEETKDKPGLDYDDYENWANRNGLTIYPSGPIRELARDKLKTAKILAQFDKTIVPTTERFEGEEEQITKFLKHNQEAFIKPRYGSLGNGIFYIKQKESKYTVDFYDDKEKTTQSFTSLSKMLAMIKETTDKRSYIIQQAVKCIRYNDSVFDVRVIMLHDGQTWHHLSQVRMGYSGKAISNIAQGGNLYATEDILSKIFSKEKLQAILAKIKSKSTGIASFIREYYHSGINEIAIDFLIDEDSNITLTELNTKPGTEGRPPILDHFFNMNAEEKANFENLSLKHGKYLALSLISSALKAPKPTVNNETKWLGMICNIKTPPVWEDDNIYPWMFRQYVLDKFLAEYNYKIVSYSPLDVDAKAEEVLGYVLDDMEYKEVTLPIPQINYDFHIGKLSDREIKGFKPGPYERWATEKGYEIFPIKPIRVLAGDKLGTAELIASYDPKVIPYTELFKDVSQIKKFLEKDDMVFIKPRHGSKGEQIFVVKHRDNEYIVEFYMQGKKHIRTSTTIAGCAPFIMPYAREADYIIQEAIKIPEIDGSVFDIRTVVFKEHDQWHYITELVVGKKGNAVSNFYQGGQNHQTAAFLRQHLPKDKAEVVLERIHKVSIDIAKMLNERFDNNINEIAFDLLVDKSFNVFISEINVKPGLAGEPNEYEKIDELTEVERELYESVTLKHGEYLVKSLLARTS